MYGKGGKNPKQALPKSDKLLSTIAEAATAVVATAAVAAAAAAAAAQSRSFLSPYD